MQLAHTTHGNIEYRIEGTGDHWVLLLHGGHMSADVRLGEDYFVERCYNVLIVSRPGYGRTPLSNGRMPEAFAEALGELLKQLNVKSAVVVGISAGGRTAMRFAAQYREMTEKLILQSSISFAPWPDLRTNVAAHVAFNSLAEKCTWRMMRKWLGKNRKAAIKLMLSNMSTLDAGKIVDGYTEQQLSQLEEVFAASRSGSGFLNDIKTAGGDASDVKVPTLIIHSNYDKTVPLAHPRLLAEQIQGSELFITEAESHMIWVSSHYKEVKHVMDEFLERSN